MSEPVEDYRHAEYLALVAIDAEREKAEVLREHIETLEAALREIESYQRRNRHSHYLGRADAMEGIARGALAR